jgi:hypothetical protein
MATPTLITEPIVRELKLEPVRHLFCNFDFFEWRCAPGRSGVRPEGVEQAPLAAMATIEG